MFHNTRTEYFHPLHLFPYIYTSQNINLKPVPLMEMENIGFYLKACWKLGVPSSDLFVTSDLYQKKDFPAVLNNLLSLARLAHATPNFKVILGGVIVSSDRYCREALVSLAVSSSAFCVRRALRRVHTVRCCRHPRRQARREGRCPRRSPPSTGNSTFEDPCTSRTSSAPWSARVPHCAEL